MEINRPESIKIELNKNACVKFFVCSRSEVNIIEACCYIISVRDIRLRTDGYLTS